MPNINVDISDRAKIALDRYQAALVIEKGRKITQEEAIEELLLTKAGARA